MNNILIFLWWIRIVANVLSYIQLWWVKEYRFDRMMVHLGTPQGKRFLIPVWKRPPISPKSVTLTIGTLVFLGWLFFRLPFSWLINLALVDVISFPLTFPLIALVNLATKLYHLVQIRRAVMKLRAHEPMRVVGITGSYGKTSTKEYLAAILSTKYKVLKTVDSKNSPIGIAEVVLRDLQSDTQIFVVEMGAYKRGEIANMSAMVKPRIGIITAINPQHQDLFGTIENTMAAKYELIAGLRGHKLGIFNADDPRVRKMSEWAKRDGRDVWWWTKKVQSALRSSGQAK